MYDIAPSGRREDCTHPLLRQHQPCSVSSLVPAVPLPRLLPLQLYHQTKPSHPCTQARRRVVMTIPPTTNERLKSGRPRLRAHTGSALRAHASSTYSGSVSNTPSISSLNARCAEPKRVAESEHAANVRACVRECRRCAPLLELPRLLLGCLAAHVQRGALLQRPHLTRKEEPSAKRRAAAAPHVACHTALAVRTCECDTKERNDVSMTPPKPAYTNGTCARTHTGTRVRTARLTDCAANARCARAHAAPPGLTSAPAPLRR